MINTSLIEHLQHLSLTGKVKKVFNSYLPFSLYAVNEEGVLSGDFTDEILNTCNPLIVNTITGEIANRGLPAIISPSMEQIISNSDTKESRVLLDGEFLYPYFHNDEVFLATNNAFYSKRQAHYSSKFLPKIKEQIKRLNNYHNDEVSFVFQAVENNFLQNNRAVGLFLVAGVNKITGKVLPYSELDPEHIYPLHLEETTWESDITVGEILFTDGICDVKLTTLYEKLLFIFSDLSSEVAIKAFLYSQFPEKFPEFEEFFLSDDDLSIVSTEWVAKYINCLYKAEEEYIGFLGQMEHYVDQIKDNMSKQQLEWYLEDTGQKEYIPFIMEYLEHGTIYNALIEYVEGVLSGNE